MVNKIKINENVSTSDMYLDFINKRVTEDMIRTNSRLIFKDPDYKKVRGVVSKIKNILSDANFDLVSANYDDDIYMSTYRYTKNEFGFNIVVDVIFDESDWDAAKCEVSVTTNDIIGDNLEEDYDPSWVEKANDDDLVLLRSELETLDVTAERIYKAVKNSVDRNNESEVSGLISQLKNINNDLIEFAEAWEID